VDPKDRLPAHWPDFDPRAILRELVRGGVDFVVIGGIAVLMHGYPRATRDLDIVFAYDDENLEALGRVLKDLNAKLRGVEEDLEFVPDRRTLRGIELLTLETSAGWFDIHRLPSGVASYARLRQNAERVSLGDFSILIASPDDLIAMKHAAGRPQDRIDIAALETIKRLREPV
jgi:Nucleotidyl transferase AbiEii toxin, Type IV TA system